MWGQVSLRGSLLPGTRVRSVCLPVSETRGPSAQGRSLVSHQQQSCFFSKWKSVLPSWENSRNTGWAAAALTLSDPFLPWASGSIAAQSATSDVESAAFPAWHPFSRPSPASQLAFGNHISPASHPNSSRGQTPLSTHLRDGRMIQVYPTPCSVLWVL